MRRELKKNYTQIVQLKRKKTNSARKLKPTVSCQQMLYHWVGVAVFISIAACLFNLSCSCGMLYYSRCAGTECETNARHSKNESTVTVIGQEIVDMRDNVSS